MINKFEIGDRVKISPNSMYIKQNSHEGTILIVKSDGWYHIRFDDGYTNSYKPGDLILTHKGYKVGDIVTIRKDLLPGSHLGGVFVNEDMSALRGKKFSIDRITDDKYYHLSPNIRYNWHFLMFETENKKTVSNGIKEKFIENKRKKIIKEIKSNKEYRECFKNVEEEVNSWTKEKIINYKLNGEK